MAILTVYEALLGELESYSPSSPTLKKALIDVGLKDFSAEYAPETHQKLVIKAAIKVLRQLISLASDSQGKSAQSYHDNLNERLKQLLKDIGEDASDYVALPSIEGGSHLW